MNATHRVHEVRSEDGKLQGYRVGTRRTLLQRGHPIYGWLKVLSKDVKPLRVMDVQGSIQYVERMLHDGGQEMSPAGVYLILTVDVDGNGVVRYVGQSVVLDTRLKRHQEGVEVSRALMEGHLRDDVPWPVPTMYRDLQILVNQGMALEYHGLPVPYGVYNDCYRYDRACRPRLKPGTTLGDVLTILEQWLMDIYRPELNVIPARKTK